MGRSTARATRPPQTTHATLVQHDLGPHPIIRHYLERMNLRGIIRDCIGATRTQALDHAEVISVLVHNVLVARGPLYGAGDPQITHGHNKDHRPDLKQLVFGLNVTNDGAVPLLHHIFSGNRTDDSVHVPNLDDLRSLLGPAGFIYVADSKLCTKGNLKHVVSQGGEFVTVMPRSRAEDRAFRDQLRSTGTSPVPWHTLAATGPMAEFSSTTEGPALTADGYRMIWITSHRKAQLDADVREAHLRQAELALRELAPTLGKYSLRTYDGIHARVQQILKMQHVSQWLPVAVSGDRSRHRRGTPPPAAWPPPRW